jgi:uncharacterized membrane protein YphA (DoxX/SURF4 family)
MAVVSFLRRNGWVNHPKNDRPARWIDGDPTATMVAVTQTLERTDGLIPTQSRWSAVTRIAFRFCFVYFGLFCLWFAQITYVFTGPVGRWLPDDAIMWQMMALDPVISWVGRHALGVDAVLHRDSGSGDQAAVWVGVFCLLVVAAIATAVWSVVDRRRTEYARLSAWFMVFIRLCLGGQMLWYGVAKVIPTQMPTPPLTALLRPFGDLSPASLLWLQVGSSQPYEIMLGAVEVVGGLLLFLPRTSTLGALVSLLCMGQVFMLNMSFDVPVKILSFHLLLMSLILLAPQIRRLANVLVLERPSEPASQPALFATPRANRIAALVQALLGIWVLIGCVQVGWQSWHEYGGGRAKSELYGIWSVTEFTVDGKPVPPLTTDENRWQRLVFDEPKAVTYQRMDGELVASPAEVDAGAITLPELRGAFAVDRPKPDQLRLDGRLDGRAVTMSLERVDLNSFTLRSRGFRWVQEYPYFT